MWIGDTGIEIKDYAETLVATIHLNIKTRAEIQAVFAELAAGIPPQVITGAGFCIFQFLTSYTEGYDAEIGFPVNKEVSVGRIATHRVPGMQVLSVLHTGPASEITQSRKKIRDYFHAHGLISDEFMREEYPDWQFPAAGVAVQYVLHNWNGLLAANLERVLGKKAAKKLMQGADALTVESTTMDRFNWAKSVMEKLDKSATEFQKFDIVSSCAHIFPKKQLQKLREVFQKAKAETNDPIKAVDAVLDFMASDPGWKEKPKRDGLVLISTKNPADPASYEKAATPAEKRAAYCFCPVIREYLDKGMPVTYCYCGAGWFREQWETATGKPVRVDVLESVLKGGDVCKFAIHLSPDV